MLSKATPKQGTASTVTPVVKLTCTKSASGRNNYAAWLAYVIDTLGVQFGLIASVMKTNVPYEVPALVPEDYTPVLPEGMGELTAANVRDLFIRAHSRRAEEVAKVQREAPMFYRALWATLSEESRNLVKAQPGYGGDEGFGANERPNELWAAIRLTHFTLENAAEGVAMADLNLLAKEKAFERLQQKPSQPIADFLREYLDLITDIEAAGVPPREESLKAAYFLDKLDKQRHGQMLVQLRNRALLGEPYPQTVQEAYVLASTWRASVASGDAGGDDGTGIFILSDEVRPAKPKAASAGDNKSAGKKGGGGAAKGGGSKTAAATDDSDVLDAAEEEARLAYFALRKCHECKQRGHARKDCKYFIARKKKEKACLLYTSDAADE